MWGNILYIGGGNGNYPTEDNLAMPILITEEMTFDPPILLLAIYPLHGGIHIYLYTDMA